MHKLAILNDLSRQKNTIISQQIDLKKKIRRR